VAPPGTDVGGVRTADPEVATLIERRLPAMLLSSWNV